MPTIGLLVTAPPPPPPTPPLLAAVTTAVACGVRNGDLSGRPFERPLEVDGARETPGEYTADTPPREPRALVGAAAADLKVINVLCKRVLLLGVECMVCCCGFKSNEYLHLSYAHVLGVE